MILIFNYQFIFDKMNSYIFLYKDAVNPAKSAFIVWFINLIPAIIFLKYKNIIELNKNMKRILFSMCVYEIFLLPLIFFNSVLGYRFLLYSFPASIYLTALSPDLKLYKFNSNIITYSIILMSNVSLAFWLKYAFHSNCWLPYKNVIFN